MSSILRVSMAAGVAIAAAMGAARGQVGARVDNWTVPESAGKAVDLTNPVAFVGMVPCRIVDTRGPVGLFGGPILPANAEREFDINSGPCSEIPAGVDAYSLNLTVTQTQGPGDLRVWPTMNSTPLVSTLNYVAGQTLANAAIVPAGQDGAITVFAAISGTHLIIDINGYFTHEPNNGSYWDFRTQSPGVAALQVRNHDAAAVGSSGIWGLTYSTGGFSFGVFGRSYDSTSSHENGGVLGMAEGMFGAFSKPLYGQAGVRGESRAGFGVLGVSRDQYAVSGSNVNVSGGEATFGALGCSDTVAVCGGGDLAVTGTKAFVEPHPTDATRVIEYVSLEGPEAGTYFRGRSKFSRGVARIIVPESFRMVTAEEGLSVQVTPIGEMATYAVVRIDLDEIVVKASRNVEFFYTVNGVRRGYEQFSPIVEMNFFVPRFPSSMMPEGLSAEAKRKLIANGTYKADGTVNMETAERLGWTEKWKGGSALKE